MAKTREMMRIKDEVILPYSETLVRANPGAFAPVRWDAASKRFLREGDTPLVAPPPPPPPADGIPDEDDDAPAERWVDTEPETDGAEEAAAPKAPKKSPKAKK
jgi:hypothetical protein